MLNPSFTFPSVAPLPQFTDYILSPFSFLIAVIWSVSATAGTFIGEPLQKPSLSWNDFWLFPLTTAGTDPGSGFQFYRTCPRAVCIHLWQKIKLHANIPKETPYQKAWQWSLYKTRVLATCRLPVQRALLKILNRSFVNWREDPALAYMVWCLQFGFSSWLPLTAYISLTPPKGPSVLDEAALG